MNINARLPGPDQREKEYSRNLHPGISRMAPKSSEDLPQPLSAVWMFDHELVRCRTHGTENEMYLIKQYVASQRMTGAVKRNQSVIQV